MPKKLESNRLLDRAEEFLRRWVDPPGLLGHPSWRELRELLAEAQLDIRNRLAVALDTREGIRARWGIVVDEEPRCAGRYPVPTTSPPREESVEITYRCGKMLGHSGEHGPAEGKERES